MTKQEAQFKHLRDRIGRRFGITLTPQLHQQMIEMIQQSKGRFVEAQSSRTTVWDLNVLDKKIRVVYDKTRKQIVTCLYPEDSLEYAFLNTLYRY